MYILETWQNKRRELTRRGSLQWPLIRVLGSGSTLTSVVKVKSQCHNSQKQVILKNGQIFHKNKNFYKMIKLKPVSWKNSFDFLLCNHLYILNLAYLVEVKGRDPFLSYIRSWSGTIGLSSSDLLLLCPSLFKQNRNISHFPLSFSEINTLYNKF